MIYVGNCGYIYGDGLFESFCIMNGKVFNFENYFNWMVEGVWVIKMCFLSFYIVDFFWKYIEELIVKLGIIEGGRVWLFIDCLGGGIYFFEINEVSFFIEVYLIEVNFFGLNVKGLEVDLY